MTDVTCNSTLEPAVSHSRCIPGNRPLIVYNIIVRLLVKYWNNWNRYSDHKSGNKT